MTGGAKTVLWWGRFDPGYSRNRILRRAFESLGWTVAHFRPWLSRFAGLEARLRRVAPPTLVFVPSFRQRDMAAAARFARRHDVPLLMDPLISAYDKQVFERAKFPAGSRRAQHLLARERALFRRADGLLADTEEHARFFAETLGVAPQRLYVVHVGAEEVLFAPGPERPPNDPPEVLFFGSFIALHGAEVIVEAARRYRGPPVRWCLLGAGPMRAALEAGARGLANLRFEPSVPYRALAQRIHAADILLGVFGASAKAGRVIPNKVFQALACAKPVITRAAPAYPRALSDEPESGLRCVPPDDPDALAQTVRSLAEHPERLAILGRGARASYERYFSGAHIAAELEAALAALSR